MCVFVYIFLKEDIEKEIFRIGNFIAAAAGAK